MRLFGISNLKIQTAGSSGSNGFPEISLEGVDDPESLRAMIMDFIRGGAPSAAATGVDVRSNSFGVAGAADMDALLTEVSAIRRLLEEGK